MSATAQGELWSTDPEAWAEFAETRNRPLYDQVAERLGLRHGSALLDAGCGTGLFAALATEHGVRVTGLDAAPGLVAYARQRVPAADFVLGDIEDLPFPDRAFDVVTALNSIPYAADPHRAIAEIARVTAPTGRVVVTVGAGSEELGCAAMIDPLASAEQVPDWDRLDLRDPDEARLAMKRAGLAIIEQSDVAFSCHFANVEEAIRAQMPAGPVEAAARNSGREAVEQALSAFFVRRVRRDGSVRMRVVFRCAMGRRAGQAAVAPRNPRGAGKTMAPGGYEPKSTEVRG